MTILFRVLRGPLFVWLLIFVALTAPVSAHSIDRQSNYVLPDSPFSTSVLVAQAIHNGTIHLNHQAPGSATSPDLSCKPAPCVLPNVQASEGGQPVNEDPIATNPANNKNLLTGGNDYNCTSLQGFYASSNGGTSWNHTCMNTLSGASGDGDPGVGFDSTGVAYITGIDTGTSDGSDIVFEKSTNGGKTWSAPAVAVKPLFSGGLTDKDWLWVDNNASSPHVNSLYVSVTQFDNSNGTEISVSHSNNGGSTWTTVGVEGHQSSPTIDQFSDVVTDKAGNVYVTWMRCVANGSKSNCGGTVASFMLSKSTDGGNTWSTPVTIGKATLAPDICGGFYGCVPNTNERLSNIPVIGIDNSTGKHAGDLYVVNYNYTAKHTSVQVTVSTDGGVKWATPVAVAPTTDKHDQFFPWMSVSSTGIIGVTWLDRRNDPSNLSYEAFAATANNVNSLVKSNVQIATKPSNPNNDGFSGMFMGDYTGNTWTPKTSKTSMCLMATWMDTSNGTNSQDEVGGYRSIDPVQGKLSGC
ncbi:MAG: sialidase family protein [Ktedonobacteraceae bacterium]